MIDPMVKVYTAKHTYTVLQNTNDIPSIRRPLMPYWLRPKSRRPSDRNICLTRQKWCYVPSSIVARTRAQRALDARAKNRRSPIAFKQLCEEQTQQQYNSNNKKTSASCSLFGKKTEGSSANVLAEFTTDLMWCVNDRVKREETHNN